jgi:ATP-dependent DNA helicase RecQ
VDTALLDRLKVLRRRLADADGVPAYIVFSDRTLVEMAQRRPRTPGELLGVSGVGAAKLERYGSEFLQEIAKSPP